MARDAFAEAAGVPVSTHAWAATRRHWMMFGPGGDNPQNRPPSRGGGRETANEVVEYVVQEILELKAHGTRLVTTDDGASITKRPWRPQDDRAAVKLCTGSRRR